MNDLQQVAKGVVLAYDSLQKDVELINSEIQNCSESIRSASDMDAMPHGTGAGDPVGRIAEKIEALEDERSAKQRYVDAVDWAEQCIDDRYSADESAVLKTAIKEYLKGHRTEAIQLVESRTTMSRSGLHAAKSFYLNRILSYLHLQRIK